MVSAGQERMDRKNAEERFSEKPDEVKEETFEKFEKEKDAKEGAFKDFEEELS